MEAILAIITGASQKFRRDDDSVDRFHHRYTVILLAAFAVISTTHQLVGEPIRCWNSAEMESGEGWVNYMHAHCWVKNTYFLPFEEEIPKEHEERDEIVYYQWIPFVFLGMAIFFFLPSVVWTSFNSKSGVDSDNILQTAENFRLTDKLDDKDKHLRLITNQIYRFVGSTPKTVGGLTVKENSSIVKNLFCLCGKKFGNYLVILYILTKVLYIGNILGQLFVLNSVLETEFNVFGIEFIKDLNEDRAFLNHTIFPKVTMCNFHIRTLGNVHRHTVQCLLTINLYTEKMFVFLWFWMVFLLILTMLSLVNWILRSALPDNRYGFIQRSLILMRCIDGRDQNQEYLCWKFVHEFLRMDGVFVLRLIRDNTNKITSSEIIASTWNKWIDSQPENDQQAQSQVDTMPMKPLPPSKQYQPSTQAKSPANFRPTAGPPPPPLQEKPAYGYMPATVNHHGQHSPTSPTAPMNIYT